LAAKSCVGAEASDDASLWLSRRREKHRRRNFPTRRRGNFPKSGQTRRAARVADWLLAKMTLATASAWHVTVEWVSLLRLEQRGSRGYRVARRKGVPQVATIYKICERESWRAAESERLFRGSAADVRDGFIHFSTAAQLAGTATTHFAKKSGLLVIAVEGGTLGRQLKWERSRGGELFPHLYAPLPLSAVLWARPLPDEIDGSRALPELEP
jgi:uncharacterized protein (DUF952 family)